MHLFSQINCINSYIMSQEMNTEANAADNFYEGFTFTQGENIITISYPYDVPIDRMVTRDFCPLVYKLYYEEVDADDVPSMSSEQLYDIHIAQMEGRPLDEAFILNHGWVGKIKEMLGWVPGTEIGFDAIPEATQINIVTGYDIEYISQKIDAEGFLCSKIYIPYTRFHLHDDHMLYLPGFQRVVCWYNINLGESYRPYIMK